MTFAWLVLLPLILAVIALRHAIRVDRLLHEQRRELLELRRMVQTLADRLGERWPGTEWPAAAESRGGAATQTTSPAGTPAPYDAAASSASAPLAAARIPPAPISSEPAAGAATLSPFAADAPQAADGMGAAGPAPGTPVAASGAMPDTESTAEAAGPPPLLPPPWSAPPASPSASAAQPASAVPAAARTVHDADSIESDIGGRWLLYIGIAALVLGVSYFLKYAFDNEWIGERTRVLFGLALGAALTALGQRFVRRGHALYGQVLSGGGIGIIYLAIFAAHRWYAIVDSPIAFIGMALTTAFAAWLADRQRSQALALLAALVGFATPFLIGGSDSAHVTLFTYDAILVAGTLFLARRRNWPALNLTSYILTAFTFIAWADRAYRPNLYASVQFFLTLFLGLFLAMLRESSRATTPAARLSTMMLALAPVMYHFASLANLRPHLGPLFVYLIAFSVAGIIAAGQLRLPWIRLLAFVGVALPLMGLVDRGFSRGWLAAGWTTVFAVYAAHLVAQADALNDDRKRMPWTEVLLLHGVGLWLLFCLEELIAPRAQAWSAPIAFGLAGWYGLLAYAARRWHRDATLHATALASALVAIACTVYFDGPALVVAIAAEGAVLVWLALQSSRLWLRLWGGALLTLAILRALVLLAEPVPIAYAPIVNPRTLSCLFIVGALYVLAELHARRERAAAAAAAGVGDTDASAADSTTRTTGVTKPVGRGTRHLLVLAANVLTLVIVSAEIDAYFDRRAWTGGVERIAGAVASAELARQLSLSIAWAVYAVALVAIGIWRGYRPIRYLAMFVFAFTILKVFIIDIATLDRVYKMLSVMALGVLLLIASYLYQRTRSTAAPAGDMAESPPPTS